VMCEFLEDVPQTARFRSGQIQFLPCSDQKLSKFTVSPPKSPDSATIERLCGGTCDSTGLAHYQQFDARLSLQR
jgi:hypothetical protein